eukprot:9391950-Pyramimonas_sp.AAC.1
MGTVYRDQQWIDIESESIGIGNRERLQRGGGQSFRELLELHHMWAANTAGAYYDDWAQSSNRSKDHRPEIIYR